MKRYTISLTLCSVGLLTYGQTTWDGSAGTDWTDGDNWSAGAPSAVNGARFDGTGAGSSANIPSSTTVETSGIDVTAGQGADFTIGSQGGSRVINLGTGGISNANGGGRFSIDPDIVLMGGDHLWSNTGNILRTRSVNLNGNNLTITSTTTHEMYGQLIDSTSTANRTVTLNGGTYALRNGGFNFDGSLVVDQEAVLRFDSNGGISSTSSTIDVTLRNGGTVFQRRSGQTDTIQGSLIFEGTTGANNEIELDGQTYTVGAANILSLDGSLNTLDFTNPGGGDYGDAAGLLLLRENGSLNLEVSADLDTSDLIDFDDGNGRRGGFEFGSNTSLGISLLSGTLEVGDTFTIIHGANFITGTPTTSSEWSYATVVNGDGGFDGVITVIPEPGTLSLVMLTGISAFALFGRTRR